MQALIIDSLGALAASAIGYVSIRRDPKWIKRITLKIDRDRT